MRFMMGGLIVILGVLLLVYGLDASESLYSKLTRLFTGAPTDKSLWLLIGGVLALGVGLSMAFTRRHHHHRTQ
jgi:uncharacterized membrane protein YqhA